MLDLGYVNTVFDMKIGIIIIVIIIIIIMGHVVPSG
jgi:hypothetical protein